MNNPTQIEFIDINTEAKHITQLFNTCFKHTSSDEEVINLVLKINNFENTRKIKIYYGKIYFQLFKLRNYI